jgi:hypothetical protein
MHLDIIDCPWCGKSDFISIRENAEIEHVCSHCKNLVDVTSDDNGSITEVKRSQGIISKTLERTTSNTPSVKIGSIHGNVSFGGDVNITNIYNQTIKLINESKSINDEQKSQAKGILDYVKNNAPPFLPIIADVIKKSLGL